MTDAQSKMTMPSSAERHGELIAKYCVPDMGGNSAVGSPLSLILERLETNRALSADDKQYLRDKGLFDLATFVDKLEDTGTADFAMLRAPLERRQGLLDERRLRQEYEIDYFESSDKRRLLGILRAVDGGARLSDQDVLWLKERELFSDALRRVFHAHEAAFHRRLFEEDGDPWQAVNGSSHFRKALKSGDALALVEKVPVDGCKDKHLQSALCTTRGGALRDLGRLDVAVASAEQAHQYDPRSFHPCTLLGALHYEMENHGEGDAWFAKAVERGAKRDSVDHELRSIFRRTGAAQREAMKRHLLALDPERYGWVNGVKEKRARHWG